MMTTKRPLTLALTALLSTTALLLPLAGYADPAKAPAAAATTTVPQSAAATPEASAPAKGDTAKAGATHAAGPSREDMRARREADREAFFSARLAALHAGLQLTPDQQGLWGPVETAIRDLVTIRQQHWRRMHEGQGAGSPIDRLTEHGEHLEKMGGALKSLAAATGPLLGSLTPEQKDRLPRLLEDVKPHRVMASAFELQDDRPRGGDWMRDHDGERMGRADRDGGMDHDGMGLHGMDHRGYGSDRMERGDMERGDKGHESMGRDERGGVAYDRADRDGPDYGRPGMDRGDRDGSDRDGGMRWDHHHHDDEDADAPG
jgi:hypothetical protein